MCDIRSFAILGCTQLFMANINSHEIGRKIINRNSSVKVHVKYIGVNKLIAMVSVFI